ncbi:MAG: hypothetical protein B0A82_11170, partial [Alkalinema sp. CACIAM 70d]
LRGALSRSVQRPKGAALTVVLGGVCMWLCFKYLVEPKPNVVVTLPYLPFALALLTQTEDVGHLQLTEQNAPLDT